MTQQSNLNPSESSLPVPHRQTSVRVPRRPEPQPAQSAGISGPFLWRTYCQWWKWVVPLGLFLASGVGFMIWHFHVPQYEASALIMIESATPYIAFEKGISSRGADRYVQTQIELLSSSVVLAPVLGRPEVATMNEFKPEFDPLKYLRKQLSVRQVGKSELYTVHYVSPSAQDAATIANVVVAEYLLMQSREDKNRSQLVIEVLEQERLERSMKVERLRRRVVELAKEITGKDPFGQGAVTDFSRALSPVGTLYQSLNEADVNLEVFRAELQALQDAPIVFRDQAESLGLLDLEISNRADVRQLETAIIEIGEKIAYVKSLPRQRIGKTWEDDPEYQRLQEELAQRKAGLEELKITLRKELHHLRVETRKVERQQLIDRKMREIASLNTKRTLLSSKFDKHLAVLKSGGAQSAQLEFAKAELEREEKVFELIAARKLALQTELDAPARVSLKQSAGVPSLSLEPIPYKLLLIACLASLVCPFGLAVAREISVQRISSAEQLASESLLPVLGEVARFPVRPVAASQKALPSRQQREMFIFAESIDSLRTNLMLTENIGGKDQHQVIAVASAASGEGKTSVATSLAVSISGATKKPTLVIDADLRSPDVANVLGVAAKPGLAEVFAGKATLAEAVHQIGDTNTYVLPAGTHRVNPHHVLHGSKVDQLFDSLRTNFSTIVVDTPPVLGASESLVYAKAADLVVFCSLVNVSRAKQVRSATERLRTTGANVAGTVLSGVPVGKYTYNYGYYGAVAQGN